MSIQIYLLRVNRSPHTDGNGATFLCNSAYTAFLSPEPQTAYKARSWCGCPNLCDVRLRRCSPWHFISKAQPWRARGILLANRQPEICASALACQWLKATYTFLNRDVPLYAGNFDRAVKFNAGETSIPQSIELHDKPLVIYREDELRHFVSAFNFLVAPSDYNLDGFLTVGCFDRTASSTGPKICLFRRPGGCQSSATP